MELYIEPISLITKKRMSGSRDSLGRIQKGCIPWNKGLRGDKGSGANTRFVKGHEAYNLKPEGTISLHKKNTSGRSYWHIKQGGKFIKLHRVLWEQHYGEIPANCIICFKDGNPENCTIENLECISRSELIARNRNLLKVAETLRITLKRKRLRAKYGLE